MKNIILFVLSVFCISANGQNLKVDNFKTSLSHYELNDSLEKKSAKKNLLAEVSQKNIEKKNFLECEFGKIDVSENQNQPGSTKKNTKPVRIDDLSKVDIKFSTLSQYDKYKGQKIDGITVEQRIKALRVVNNCINNSNGAIRPNTMYLSQEQKEAVMAIFNRHKPDVIKKITKAHKFGSLSEFQLFVEHSLSE